MNLAFQLLPLKDVIIFRILYHLNAINKITIDFIIALTKNLSTVEEKGKAKEIL